MATGFRANRRSKPRVNWFSGELQGLYKEEGFIRSEAFSRVHGPFSCVSYSSPGWIGYVEALRRLKRRSMDALLRRVRSGAIRRRRIHGGWRYRESDVREEAQRMISKNNREVGENGKDGK